MTTCEQTRLAEIRQKTLLSSAQFNTTTWETPFLLRLLDEKSHELEILKRALSTAL